MRRRLTVRRILADCLAWSLLLHATLLAGCAGRVMPLTGWVVAPMTDRGMPAARQNFQDPAALVAPFVR